MLSFDKSKREQVKIRQANYGQTASGYGRKLPTQYMVNYIQRWRRVYVMQFSNSGSTYIIIGGREVFIDVYDGSI